MDRLFFLQSAGSGKGFASEGMQKDLFKVRDVDEWESVYKLSSEMKRYSELKD